MSDKMVKMFGTFFYIGDIPFAPGTIASAVGAMIYLCFYEHLFFYALLTIGITFLGLIVSGPLEAILKQKDPSCIVIDEVAGVMIAFFMLPINIPVAITAFFLFRAFDMFKLYPANKFEDTHGSVGVMMDDILAGLYTNITMQIAVRWAGIV